MHNRCSLCDTEFNIGADLDATTTGCCAVGCELRVCIGCDSDALCSLCGNHREQQGSDAATVSDATAAGDGGEIPW